MTLHIRIPTNLVYSGPDREEVYAAMAADGIPGDYDSFEVLDGYTNFTLDEIYGQTTLARRTVPAAECDCED